MAAIAILLLGIGPGAAHAQEWRPQIRMTSHLFIQADILGVRPEGTVRLGGGTIEASETRSGKASFAIDFTIPGGDHVSAIDVQISDVTLGDAGLQFSVSTSVDVSSARRGPARIERARDARLNEGGSCLHQVYEDAENERSIVLTLTAESKVVPEVAVPPSSSRVIVFHVALSRIDASGPVPIETNILRTFDGSSVAYSFTTARADSPASAPASAPSPSAAPSSATDPASSTVAPKSTGGKTADADHVRIEGPAEATTTAPAGSSATRGNASGGSDTPHPPSSTLEGRSAPESATQPGGGGEQLELTLVPTLSSQGVLVVEATLRGPADAHPGAGSERRVLVHRTQVLSNGSAFDLAVEGTGGAPSYRFNVHVEF